MKIRRFVYLIIVLAALTLTGCWDMYEISDHTIITLVGVDKVEDKFKLFSEYRPVHAQIPDTKNDSLKASNILIGEGKNFEEARHSYLRKNPDDVFLGAVRAVVFSDRYAKNGIEEYLNRIRGIGEYRKTISLFTTSEELVDIFDAKALSIDNVGFNIEHLSSQMVKNGIDNEKTIAEIIEDSQVKNTGYLLDNLDIVKKGIEVTGYSVFKDNKKVGKISVDKMKGNNYILIKDAEAVYTNDIEGVTATLTAKTENKKIAVYYDNKDITFNIKISLKCEILNTSKLIKIEDEQTKELEKKISEKVSDDISQAIETSKTEYGCDYLYFYKYFRAKYNSDFKNMNWNEKYKEAKFNIEVKAKVNPSNMINFK